MGIALSCCGRSTATEDSNALKLRPGLPKGRKILKLMVEVNALSSDDGPLRWEPYLNGLVPLWLSCIQEGDTYIYEVTASAADGRIFSSNILVPGTVLRKTSECFVQWRDLEKGGAWGLNFGSESETIRFLDGCTPIGASPEAAGLRHTTSAHSLALPTPAPPTTTLSLPAQDDPLQNHLESPNQAKESSFTVNRPLSQGQFSTASGADRLPTPDMSVQSLPLDNPHLERYTPPPGFGLNSPKTAGDTKFEFPTPLIAGVVTVTIATSTPIIMETAPLSDIQEDREIERSVTEESVALSNTMNTTTASNESTAPNCTQDDFDIPLPSTLPPPPPITLPPSQNALSKSRFSQFLNDIDSSLLEFTGIKPLSPPSPLKEEEGTDIEPKSQPILRDPSSHSIRAVGDAGMERSSSIIDLGELVLDVSEVSGYSAQFRDEIVNRHKDEEAQDETDSTPRQQEGEGGDGLSPLPPATSAEDDDISPPRNSNLKITPSFLRTLLPPQEFSSNSEPLSTYEGSARAQEVAREKRGAVRPKDLRNSFTATRYKEELSPVHGYSGGSRTNTSSGSLKSVSSDGDKAGGADYNGDETRTNSQDDLILPSAATRKAGWLEVKTVLVRKNQTVAMKPKRRWKKYWAALKGTQLVLYQCNDPTAIPENQPPDTTLDLELSLAHPIHDHMKRDHLFCLSTYNGDTFYLQTSGQSDVEDWIRAIHSAAAISLIQCSTKEESLQRRIEKLNELISSENQLSKLAELELKTVVDYASRSAIVKQLVKFSENIERYSVELYKLKCYVASAHGEETPNPQSLLGHISKTTKTFLSNIGMFSVASLHALVCARDAGSPFSSGYGQSQTSKAKLTSPALSRRFGMNGTKTKVTTSISSKFSGRFKKPNITPHDISGPIPLSPLPLPATKQDDPIVNEVDKDGSVWMEGSDPGDLWTNIACTIQVKMPNNKVCNIPLRSQMTVRDVLVSCCEKHRLEVEDHFLRLRTETYGGEFECDIPNENELFTQLYSKLTKVELCQKLIHTVILSKPDDEQFGLTLEPCDVDGLRRVVVTKVEEGSPADTQDINEGDEVLLMNDNLVTNLHWNDIITAIKAPSISLTLRTSQIEMPLSGVLYSNVLNSLVCPPPPSSDDIITKETLEGLIIPMPSLEDLTKIGEDGIDERVIPPESAAHSQEQIDALIKDTRAISVQVRAWDAMEVEDSQPVSKGAPWTSEDRLRKCIGDLLESEQQHAKTIEVLMERYLQPMRKELIVSQDEITALSGNITEVADFENKFLRSLEDGVRSDGQATGTAKVVMAIATTFLCNAEQLQLYSGLCTSHSRARALGEIKDNERLQSFLDARNPGKNPRLTLDSLLGKLILRVSRYPLFLRSMLDNTIEGSEERHQLLDAIESTDRAANYINEMQRVCETYSSLFDGLLRESKMSDYGVSVNVGQLRCHGEVMWLNQKDELLGRAWKKGQGPNVLCFVFNSCLILLQKEKKGRRRTSKTKLSSELTADEVKHKILLPCLLCRVQDLPDSDGVTNMWQLLYKGQPSLPAVSYLFRSNSVEQKATMVHLVRDSIQEQQKLFGTLGATPSPSLNGQGSVVGSSSSALSQPIKTKTNSKFSSLFTAYSTQTL